jgi:hypothetical protein
VRIEIGHGVEIDNRSSVPGLTRQPIRFQKKHRMKIDGCAGQARA